MLEGFVQLLFGQLHFLVASCALDHKNDGLEYLVVPVPVWPHLVTTCVAKKKIKKEQMKPHLIMGAPPQKKKQQNHTHKSQKQFTKRILQIRMHKLKGRVTLCFVVILTEHC